MTNNTENLIIEYADTLNTRLLPSIIIGMQEEDNVAGVISFRNCFKQLRNICAHEPETLVAQLKSGSNTGNSKLVFKPREDKGGVDYRVTIDVVHLTAWLFEMRLLTGNPAYLVFWEAFMRDMYPAMSKNNFRPKYGFDLGISKHGNLVKMFGKLQEYLWENFGELKTIGMEDPYAIQLLVKNEKAFWRMAIPNMTLLLKMFLCGAFDLTNDEALKTYIVLLREREGV